MARRRIAKPQFNEKQFAKALRVVNDVLSEYGLELGDTIRFRRIASHDQWEQVKVAGINKDLSILCFDQDKRTRSFLPGYAVDLELKGKGPRGGITWKRITHSAA